MKRSPVIGDEVTGTETLEQGQRIVTREMTASEAGFPPRRMSDRQKREIEAATSGMEDRLDHSMRRLGESGITGKEAGPVRRLEQVHVRGTPPVVEAIAIAPVLGCHSVNRQFAELKRVARVDCLRLLVAGTAEPLLHWPWREDRNGLRQRSQRGEGQVVGMRVGHQHCIERRKLVDGHPRRGDPPQDASECGIEVWVSEDSLPSDLDEKRRVPDVGDPDSFGSTHIRVRSLGRVITR